MLGNNIKVVEKLNDGRLIIKIEKEIMAQNGTNKITKYTIADRKGIINILDSKGELSGIQFFDTYSLNKFGDIIIGLKKDGEEYYKRVLACFDLRDTEFKAKEIPSGPFNIGPYSEKYYDYKYPTKTLESMVPQSYSFNYGLINRNGLLVIYPTYDKIQFGTENTCIVGLLRVTANLKLGYNDILSGDAITPVCFDSANNFSESKAVVRYNNRYGYIDRKKVITNPENSDEYAEGLAPIYFRATDFKDGIATVIIDPGNCFDSYKRAKIDEYGTIVEFLPHARVLRRRSSFN